MTEVESRDTEDPYAGVDLIPELCRVRNPWLQILRDMTAPAPMSHWAAEVTSRRILRYDRVRPFATRGAFLVAAAIFLSAAPDTWWLTWALLIPSSVQVVLEILLEPLVGAADRAARRHKQHLHHDAGASLARRFADVAREN